MSDVATPLGAPARPVALDVDFCLRSAIVLVTLLLVWITLNPFPDLSGPPPEGSLPTDFLYHMVALTLLGSSVAIAAALLRPALSLHVRTCNVVLLLWLAVAVVTSQYVELSARRLLVTLTDVGLAALLLLVPRGLQHFSRLLLAAVGTSLLVCYLGLLFTEHSVHHFTDALEADLTGAWRGTFEHKNTAGAMMATFAIIGLFGMRAGHTAAGIAIAVAASIFLFMTQSKNALAFLPLVLLLAAVAERCKSLVLCGVVCLAPLLLLNVFTVGTVYSGSLRSVVEALPIDTTFTGRTEIWSYVAEQIAERPITGYGLRAFWHTTQAMQDDSSTAWLAVVANSHNGYLDLALTIGIPGLALMLVAIAIYPCFDFHRRLREPNNELMAWLCLRIWLFGLYTSTFESFFFDRAFPSWFMTMLAVFGLRYASKLRISS
jgi:O-antigen ligase